MSNDWIDPVRSYVAFQTQADLTVGTIKEPALRGPSVERSPRTTKPAKKVRARSAAAPEVIVPGSEVKAMLTLTFQRADGSPVSVRIDFAIDQSDVPHWVQAAQMPGSTMDWQEG